MVNTLETCIVFQVRVQASSAFPQDLVSVTSFRTAHLSFTQLAFRCSRHIFLPLPPGKRQRGVPRAPCCFSQNLIFRTTRRQSWNSKLNVHSFAYKPPTQTHLKRCCLISYNIDRRLWGFVCLIASSQCSHKPYHTFPQIQVGNT